MNAAEFLEGFSDQISFVPRQVLPGDEVQADELRVSKKPRLGRGIRRTADGRILATRAGRLSYAPSDSFWVSTAMKRYFPQLEDAVIGIVDDKTSTAYRINIFGTSLASLPLLAFDGATKRNKPSLQVGTVVYARIVVPGIVDGRETELSCKAVVGPQKEWHTGEATFGALEGGALIRCSLDKVPALRREGHVALSALGQAIPFQICVGSNGAVWVASRKPQHTVLVLNALSNSFLLSEAETDQMIKGLLRKLEQDEDDR